jgi:TRAP transporter TAXI family solute receptor
MKTIKGGKTMSKQRIACTFAVTAAVLAALFAFSAINPAYAAERKSIRWATSSTGSYGYKVAAQMISILEDALGGEYTVTVNPYPSTTAAMKAVMDGNGEIGYTADVGMTQVYAGEGGFKNYTPTKAKMVHTWYAYPMESFMAVYAPKASQFKSWGDFSGKPVFFTPAGFMNWLNFQRIFKALGYQFKHVQIGEAAQGDALQAGTIVGAVAYTTAGRSLASYWRETELRTDIKVINPSPEEVKKLTAADLAPVEVDAKKAFSQDVGVKTILGVPILFGYNVCADMPGEVVYKMLNRFYKERDTLAKADPGFGPMARDFVGMQVNGIKANPTIPVHAGMAKFLKEQKAWNDKWTIAGK